MYPYFIYIGYKSLFAFPQRSNTNELNFADRLTGDRKAAFSEALDIREAKEKAKRIGLSLNDLIIITTNLSLSQMIR